MHGSMESKRLWRDETQKQFEDRTLSEAKFQHIYDNSPVMMHSIDAEGVICNVNKMWLETTGYRAEEVIGKRADFLMTRESSERAFQDVIPRFWREGFVRDIHYQYIKKSGEIFDVLLNCTATVDPLGRRVSLSVTRDITDKLRIERELREYQGSLEAKVAERTAELQRAQEAMVHQARLASVGTMLSGFAHEIRNPLNFCAGGARQLTRQLDHLQFSRSRDHNSFELTLSKAHQSLNLIQEGNERIAGIVEHLKTFSESREHPREEPCDINTSISATLILLRSLLEQNRIEVRWSPEDYPSVLGNQIELKQVLFNLIHNACLAMPNGGVLSIQTKRDTFENVVTTIQDSGDGIPSEHRARIFDPFYTTRDPGEGTGLGLSIAHTICRRHGGDLVLDQGESGASFTFFFQPFSSKSTRRNIK